MKQQQIAFVLEEITNWDEHGIHFTNVWRDDIIFELENNGYIEITRYDSKNEICPKCCWTVTVTEKGKEFINSFNKCFSRNNF